jgi:3-phosphoshikimate 1-carboxyvinyltransferase
MTLAIMRQFGAKAQWNGERKISVEAVPYSPTPYYIENDWSAASYWYEMVALSGDRETEVVLPGLIRDSLQGDSEVAKLFSHLGVKTTFNENSVCLTKKACGDESFVCNMVNQPDLAQTMVVTCCMLGKHFRISGLQTLRIKETDRIAALQNELGKLGYKIGVEGDDTMFWNGEKSPHMMGADDIAIDTYEDHRMAMAFAPVALKRDSITINNPDVVSKSYPSFWEDMKKAGFKLA